MPRSQREKINSRSSKIKKQLLNAEYDIHQENLKITKRKDQKSKYENSKIILLDNINLRIVEALVNNGDIKSADIAAKLDSNNG